MIAYAPREGVLIERVNATVKALGDDLLSSTLTAQVRAALDEQIESWSELHLELSFDEAWADRDGTAPTSDGAPDVSGRRPARPLPPGPTGWMADR